jgi:hypothetical protein
VLTDGFEKAIGNLSLGNVTWVVTPAAGVEGGVGLGMSIRVVGGGVGSAMDGEGTTVVEGEFVCEVWASDPLGAGLQPTRWVRESKQEAANIARAFME